MGPLVALIKLHQYPGLTGFSIFYIGVLVLQTCVTRFLRVIRFEFVHCHRLLITLASRTNPLRLPRVLAGFHRRGLNTCGFAPDDFSSLSSP